MYQLVYLPANSPATPTLQLHNSVGYGTRERLRRRLYDGDGGKPNASTTRRGAVTWQKETEELRLENAQQAQQIAQQAQQMQRQSQEMQNLKALVQQMLERGDGRAPAAAGGSVSDWASSLFGSRTV